MKNKGFAPIIAIVLLALVGLIGYLGYQNFQLRNAPSPTPSPTPRASTTPDPTANWKMYENNTYKYSLKYPSSWKIDTTSPQTTFLEIGSVNLPGTYAKVSISTTGENDKSVEDLAKSWRSGTLETTQVDDETAAEILQNPNPEGEPLVQGSYTLSVFVKNKSKINLLIQLETANLNTYRAIFDQILSTFQFTGDSQFCGGIQGIMCSEGYSCKLEGDYPDAGGTCVKD